MLKVGVHSLASIIMIFAIFKR